KRSATSDRGCQSDSSTRAFPLPLASIESADLSMSLKVTMLAPSISWRAGGMRDCVLNLAQFLKNKRDVHVDIVSLDDELAAEDWATWGNLSVHVVAPKHAGFRYAPGLLRQLSSLTPNLVHTHGIWTYLSIATNRWAKSNDGVRLRPYVVSTHGMLDPWALHHSRWKKIIAGFAF